MFPTRNFQHNYFMKCQYNLTKTDTPPVSTTPLERRFTGRIGTRRHNSWMRTARRSPLRFNPSCAPAVPPRVRSRRACRCRPFRWASLRNSWQSVSAERLGGAELGSLALEQSSEGWRGWLGIFGWNTARVCTQGPTVGLVNVPGARRGS